MTLQQIKYIAEISKHGSISKASQELLVAQPHLSSTLKNLENELGIQIFSRTRKGVELTPDGKEFLSYAKLLLAQEEKILELYSQAVKPIFRFSLSTQRYPFVVKSFYEFFSDINPQQYEVRLREANMYNVIHDVFNKKSDIGIIFLSDTTENFIKRFLASKNLEFHLIKEIKPCVFFRKDHVMAEKDSVSLEEMRQFPFASFDSETSISPEFSEEALFYNTPKEKKNFYVSDRGTMINILTHTDAFSIGTGILSPGFAGPELISKPISDQKIEIKLGWIQNVYYNLSKSELGFIDKITEVVNSYK